MIYSVILKSGENIVYQYSQHNKPTVADSISLYEFNKALPEWEHTAKSYLVKKEDVMDFKTFMEDGRINVGVPVPYSDVEIYEDDSKKYARYKKGEGNVETAAVTQLGVQKQSKPNETASQIIQQQQKEHKFHFKVEIDDDNGEPKLAIKNDANPDSMDFKLLKSFIIKGMKGGVKLVQGIDGEFEISLGNK